MKYKSTSRVGIINSQEAANKILVRIPQAVIAVYFGAVT